MIITCPECTTRFNVADERIPQAGCKVRCARCKHVFPVAKPLDHEAPEADNFGADLEGVTGKNPASESSAFTMESVTKEPDSLPDDHAEFSGMKTAGDDFDYDRFRELDADKASAEEFAFGSEDEELAPAPATKPAPATDLAAIAASDREQEESEPLAAKPAKKRTVPTAPKNSAFSILIKTMLLLILAALIGGGALLYIDRQEEFHEKFRQLLGQASESPAGSGQIALGALDGKFLTNEYAGEIFVVRGEAINNFSQPRSAIQVKGVLHDQRGKPLMQKTVFSGNPISDEELRVLPFEEIERHMGNQFGRDLSNMKVDPHRKIPFTIVFKDLPSNIAEFSVKATSSRPTAD